MIRTVSLKLLDPPAEEFQETAEAFRVACNRLSVVLASGHPINAIALIKTCYKDLRRTLPSQMAQSAARVVVGVWKSFRGNRATRPPRFRRPFVCYQINRDWSLRQDGRVSIKTLNDRVDLEFQTYEGGRERLREAKATGRLGGARLKERRKGWFLSVTTHLPTPPSYDPITPIGVDRGIRVMAVARAPLARPLVIKRDLVRHYRSRSRRLRQRLARKGTPSSRRVLRRLGAREKRFVQNQVCLAAKRIIDYSRQFERPIIVLEDLGAVRKVARRTREQRNELHNWEYDELSRRIRLAAEGKGIPVAFVDPSYTNQECPKCRFTARQNREGSWFTCRSCEYQNHADVIGATNIQRRWLDEHASGATGPIQRPTRGA